MDLGLSIWTRSSPGVVWRVGSLCAGWVVGVGGQLAGFLTASKLWGGVAAAGSSMRTRRLGALGRCFAERRGAWVGCGVLDIRCSAGLRLHCCRRRPWRWLGAAGVAGSRGLYGCRCSGGGFLLLGVRYWRVAAIAAGECFSPGSGAASGRRIARAPPSSCVVSFLGRHGMTFSPFVYFFR